MTSKPIDLATLLGDLAAARGPRRRLRLLGRYWRDIQGLSPEDRQRVALAAGSEALWARLEKLFARDGGLSDGELAVKEVLEGVGRADPSELRALARRVRGGDVAGVGRELLELVGGALDEVPSEAAEGAEVAESEARAATASPEGGAPSSSAEPLPSPGESPQEALSPADEPQEPLSPADATLPEPALPTPPDPVLPTKPSFPEPPPGLSADPALTPETILAERVPSVEGLPAEPPSRDGVATPRRADTGPPTPTSAAEAMPYVSPAALLPISSARERLAELRRLGADRAYARGLGSDGRAQLVARLGAGWAGRRALSELIRSRAVDGLGEALRLIGTLSGVSQRAWCLGDIVEHWDLSPEDRERVLDAAESPAARRRLARRAERRAERRHADSPVAAAGI